MMGLRRGHLGSFHHMETGSIQIVYGGNVLDKNKVLIELVLCHAAAVRSSNAPRTCFPPSSVPISHQPRGHSVDYEGFNPARLSDDMPKFAWKDL